MTETARQARGGAWVLAEFEREAPLLEAARGLRALGYGSLDIHSPYAIHGAEEALGLKRSTVPIVALIAAVTGAVTGYLIQWGTVGYLWPLNVGGRPPHSAPAFIPVTFELAVLFCAVTIFVSLLFAYFRFPRVHHPVFEVEAFRSATIDGLWLSVEVETALAEKIAAELRRLGAHQVSIVDAEAR